MVAFKNLFQTAKTTHSRKFIPLNMGKKASKNSAENLSRHNEVNEQAHHTV